MFGVQLLGVKVTVLADVRLPQLLSVKVTIQADVRSPDAWS
jgi:hypothetical protein